ncbi:MAG: DNA polymerase III subunit beta [Nitrospirota bacterium]|nr:DNA polymerase III subunit beta [Nitrospirota bacterium]
MKIRIAQEELVKALQQFHSVAGRKSTMPILSNILLEARKDTIVVFATDLEIGIRGIFPAEVQEEGAVTLSCRHLMDIVRELPAADISIGSLDNNWVSITCGKSDFKIAGLSAEEFPSWPEFDSGRMIEIDGGLLSDMIRKTIYCVAENETRYVLNGACFKIAPADGGTMAEMVGTDGHRLALIKKNIPGAEATEGPGVIIPKKGLLELRKLLDDKVEKVSFSIGKNQILFKKDSVELFARLIEGNYPNYNQVIPSRNEKKLAIQDKKVFASAIKRVSVLAKDKVSAVRMDIAPEKITLVVNNPELGEATEEMAVSYSAEPLSIAFNARYVLDALQAVDGDEVTISLADQVSPSIITAAGDTDCLAVIMPLRI